MKFHSSVIFFTAVLLVVVLVTLPSQASSSTPKFTTIKSLFDNLRAEILAAKKYRKPVIGILTQPKSLKNKDSFPKE